MRNGSALATSGPAMNMTGTNITSRAAAAPGCSLINLLAVSMTLRAIGANHLFKP